MDKSDRWKIKVFVRSPNGVGVLGCGWVKSISYTKGTFVATTDVYKAKTYAKVDTLQKDLAKLRNFPNSRNYTFTEE